MATSESATCCAEVEDTDSIECFQNYTASEVFIQGLAGLIDQQDVESMIRAQKQILQRFEKTNEMLSNCNTLSVTRLKVANQQFKNYRQVLVDVKKDLDYTFKKINLVKSKLRSQYPESVTATTSKAGAGELKPSEIDTENSTTLVSRDSLTSTTTSATAAVSDAAVEFRSRPELAEKKTEASDSNSSESGEADSQAGSTSTCTSDTA